MLSVDVIQGIRIFMDRVQLQGREVQAYNRVMMALAQEEHAIVEEARKAQEAAKQDGQRTGEVVPLRKEAAAQEGASSAG